MSKSASCLSMLLLTPLGMLWRGYVLSVLYAWFIVPQFSVKPMSIPVALGIGVLMALLTKHPDFDKEDVPKSSDEHRRVLFVKSATWTVFMPLFALLYGYFFHLFAR